MRHLIIATGLWVGGTSVVGWAASSSPDGGTGKKATHFDLGLNGSNFAPVPKGDGMEKVKQKDTNPTGPTTTSTDATYTVVRVTHGKSFVRSPDGAKSSTPFDAVQTQGDPPVTEKFSSVVRVRCPQKLTAPIEVAILDFRDDTLMEAKGTLAFKGGKEPESEWTVDWDPTPLARGPGDYKLLVRVAGQPMGTFPLKMAAPPEKKK